MLLAALALVVSAAACGSLPELPKSIPQPGVLVAQAKGDHLDVFARSGDGTPVSQITPVGGAGSALVCLVLQDAGDWIMVALPGPPPGATGWIRAADVDLNGDQYRMTVSLSMHTLTVTDATGTFLEAPLGVGQAATPAPGEYFIAALFATPDPNGPYGPNAYGFSGFTNGITGPGAGVTGITGTNDPASVGRDVPDGTLRIRNADLAKLVPVIPLGTPVDVLS